MPATQPAGEHQPIGTSRHVDIAENDIRRLAGGEYRDGVGRITRFDHQEAGKAQIIRGGATK